MSVSFQIIQSSDLEDILEFEQKIMEKNITDESERMIQSWHSRGRKESLAHYLPMGWSFIARDKDNKILGYFLGQPLLFFDGFTQSLWVEHIQSTDSSILEQLCEIAYKLSREKHFQKVYFPKGIKPAYSESWKPEINSAWTAKVSR